MLTNKLKVAMVAIALLLPGLVLASNHPHRHAHHAPSMKARAHHGYRVHR